MQTTIRYLIISGCFGMITTHANVSQIDAVKNMSKSESETTPTEQNKAHDASCLRGHVWHSVAHNVSSAAQALGQNIGGSVGSFIQTLGTAARDTDIHYWKDLNPHKNEIAHVRLNTELFDEEKQFINERLNTIAIAQNRLAGRTTPKKIALVLSGGGPRSEFYFHGALKSLKESGLLDAIAYVVTQSGSSWAVGPLWAYANNTKNLDHINNIIENAITNASISLAIPPPLTAENIDMFARFITRKILFNEPVTIVDAYSYVLHYRLMKNVPAGPNGLELEATYPPSLLPYPIYTGFITETTPYSWVEFTPHATGSVELHTFVPTYAFGRSFNKGVSLNFEPAQELGYIMGISSANFGGSLKELQDNLRLKTGIPFIDNTIAKLLTTTEVGNLRFGSALINNFARGIQGHPLKDATWLNVADTGILYNNPIIPALRKERQIDALIVLDTTQQAAAGDFMQAAGDALRRGYKLPSINSDAATASRSDAVYVAKDSSSPTIMYKLAIDLPNYGPTGTYSPEQARAIAQEGYNAMEAAKESIIDTLKNL